MNNQQNLTTNLNEKFIKDGIVDKEKWKNQRVKILFILKEVNGDIGVDLISWLRKNRGLYGKTYPQVVRWGKTILEYFNNQSIALEEVIDNIAVINLKKTAGVAQTNYKELKTFLKKYKNILRKQIDEINPKIIVCGNVGELFFDVYNEQISKIKKYKVCEENPPLTMYLHNERVVFNAYHPSAWKNKTTQEDFIKLLDKKSDAVRMILKDNKVGKNEN